MKRRTFTLIGMLCVSAMLIIGCQSNTSDSRENNIATEDQTENTSKDGKDTGAGVFGNFETQTLDGNSVTQAIFADADLTMVNIWGTFCGPCINEMPELGEISKEYANKGVQIVGIISDVYEPKDKTAMSIVEQTGVNYTNLVLNQELYSNLPKGIQAVPTTIFVNKDGNQVGETYVGAKDKESWIKIIDKLLNQVAQ